MARSNEVSRRRFLSGAVAAATAPTLIALAQAEAATKKKAKPAAAKPAPPAAPAGPQPDWSVAKTPEERTALEKQWKQTLDLLDTLRKVQLPTGSEFANGALAPLKLRRGEA